jgi:hypothetical protein
MKLFKVFAGIMGFFALVFLVSLFFPRQYKIERSIAINLPVQETFAYLNEVENWQDWSPWNQNLDSTMRFFYSQNKSGIGAAQYFRGNLIGIGRFRIIESLPNEKIQFNLSLDHGFMNINQTFLFSSVDGKTQLTWLDEGDVGFNPIFRFMLPTRIQNSEIAFEEGLLTIKRAAEKKSLLRIP